MESGTALLWLRRDLRLADHAALSHLAQKGLRVVVCFVFDPHILLPLKNPEDRRLTFIYQSLQELDAELKKHSSQLVIAYGKPETEIPRLAKLFSVLEVHASKDYEPKAKARDLTVQKALSCPFFLHKDQAIHEGLEIATQEGKAFRVFTPYANAWRKNLHHQHYAERSSQGAKYLETKKIDIAADSSLEHWTLERMGFKTTPLWIAPGRKAALKQLKSFLPKVSQYKEQRDFPSLEGTSGLSVHLRFGTLSVRECLRSAMASENSGTWVNELIWRDFYFMILDQFPHVATGAFKRELDQIQWPGKEEHLQAWKEGRTGFPLVDAAMRHFNATGWMHNRLRMVVASFLTKDLLVHWQEGEKYFAAHLLDFDLSANNGGWQWSASTGCDAQPYFRIFNPYSQSKKFDPKGTYIRRFVPELSRMSEKEIHCPPTNELFSLYPAPIVDHGAQRLKALSLFKRKN
jgi:deoxyribodipyrimidine photo-lyase